MKKLIILTIILFTVQFLAPIFAQNEQKPEFVVQTGHTEFVYSVAFSPNGKLLASGGTDQTVKLWDVASGKELKTFSGIYPVIFSPDGKTLISGGINNTIILWDVITGQKLKTFLGHTSSVGSVSISPDGKTLASGSQDKSVKLWSVVSGQELKTLKGNNVFVYSVAFSPDGKLLASGNHDNTVKLWNVESGQELNTFSDHTSPLESVAFSPDGKILSSVSRNGIMVLWNVRSLEQIRTFKGARLTSFSPDGKVLATVYGGGIRLLDVTTGQELKTLISQEPIAISSVSFSPNGKTIAVAGDKKNIELWNVDTGQELKGFSGHSDNVNLVRFSAAGKMLAVSYGVYVANGIAIWDLNSGQKSKSFDSGFVELMEFSPDGKILATVSPKELLLDFDQYDAIIRLWDMQTGQELHSLSGHNRKVTTIVFSPDSKIIVSNSLDGTIKFWNIASGKELKTFSESATPFETSIAFSPDGKILAIGSSDNTIKLWNVLSGQTIKTFAGHENFVYSVAFSPDGKTLASGSHSHTIKLWNVASGKELKSFAEDDSNIAREVLAVVPRFHKQEDEPIIFDGKFQIKKVGTAGKLNLFDVKTNKLLANLVAMNEKEWAVFLPNGRFDTNKLENPEGLHWIMPEAPLTPLSFEVFMRDYYEPNLLPRLLKCTEENNCETEFKSVRNLTELNRTQPKVRIAEVKATDAADVVQVTVEAEDAVSEYQRDKQNKPLRSNVADLRLFRDGQLVGYAPDGEGAVGLDGQGKFTKIFNVRLPKNRDVKDFTFTAYAFNSDRVKSETAEAVYTLPKPLAAAKGSAYIVTIGVNANENRGYDLRYAANDARRLQSELVKRLPSAKYEKIVQIPLISDYGENGKLTENNATKQKIKAVLDKLAGKTVLADALKDVANAELLKKVLPEDLVLIAFSGHGYADREGIFYLVPYDIGATASGGLGSVLTKSISSDELSLWLRDIDAGEMMMIVDACHSAAAVQGKDFKPGPMGSRGLGQLSYDKGMRILTATQADNVALELRNLQHGLLTYSLVKNGIELGLADFQPKDNKLFSNEWLSYAVKDVPLLYEKILNGEIKGLLINGAKPKSDVFRFDEQKSNLNLQQPALFDFSRRDRQYELLNVFLE